MTNADRDDQNAKALEMAAQGVPLVHVPRPGPKPLFVPLKTEYFEQFRSGEKTYELRKFGPRWNAQTCFVGRPVVLSKGYGNYARLNGRISRLNVKDGRNYSGQHRQALMALYGTDNMLVAEIHIELERSHE